MSHTQTGKKATYFENKNLLSILFYIFTFLCILTLFSILFYCWILLLLPVPLCSSAQAPSLCLGSSGRQQRRRWARKGNWVDVGPQAGGYPGAKYRVNGEWNMQRNVEEEPEERKESIAA